MALLQEIWTGKIPDFLRRKFLMRGGLRMQMPADIQPIVDIDNVEIGDRLSLGERIFNVGITQGAVVGQFSRIALSIAAGQQFLAEIEGILLAISAGANIIETHDSTILANTTVVLDGDSRADRWALTPASPLIAEFDTNVGLAGGASAATYTIFAAGQQFFPTKLVLAPGHRVTYSVAVVNLTFTAIFFGRYRATLPGEL